MILRLHTYSVKMLDAKISEIREERIQVEEKHFKDPVIQDCQTILTPPTGLQMGQRCSMCVITD